MANNKRIALDINVGIGDHLALRMFLDGVRHEYDQIAITHSRPGMTFWHKDDPRRWNFNLKLAKMLFSEPPYILIPNANFPFFPNDRIVRELNNKPVIPNVDCLCVGTALNVENYVILTTKIRQFPKVIFDQYKEKLEKTIKKLSENKKIVIIGEREVEKTREYTTKENIDQVFGIYDFWKSILNSERIIDLTIPALGIIPSTMPQLQQDCLLMKNADAVITFGIGGNVWLAACTAKKTIGLRVDSDWITDLIQNSNLPGLHLTKDIDQFTNYLENLH